MPLSTERMRDYMRERRAEAKARLIADGKYRTPGNPMLLGRVAKPLNLRLPSGRRAFASDNETIVFYGSDDIKDTVCSNCSCRVIFGYPLTRCFQCKSQFTAQEMNMKGLIPK